MYFNKIALDILFLFLLRNEKDETNLEFNDTMMEWPTKATHPFLCPLSFFFKLINHHKAKRF